MVRRHLVVSKFSMWHVFVHNLQMRFQKILGQISKIHWNWYNLEFFVYWIYGSLYNSTKTKEIGIWCIINFWSISSECLLSSMFEVSQMNFCYHQCLKYFKLMFAIINGSYMSIEWNNKKMLLIFVASWKISLVYSNQQSNRLHKYWFGDLHYLLVVWFTCGSNNILACWPYPYQLFKVAFFPKKNVFFSRKFWIESWTFELPPTFFGTNFVVVATLSITTKSFSNIKDNIFSSKSQSKRFSSFNDMLSNFKDHESSVILIIL